MAFTSRKRKLYFLTLAIRIVNLFDHWGYMSQIYIACFLMALLFAAPSLAGTDKLVLVAVGDIMPAGSATATLARKGYDYPFSSTVHILRTADVSVGNLEAPLTRRGNEYSGKKFRFRADPRSAAALRSAGFSVLTLANNHIMDFGSVGLQDTLSALRSVNILHTGACMDLAGARGPAILRRKGKIIAFLAYSLTQPLEFFATANRAGAAPGYARYFREDIRRAKTMADHVVVSFHWGAELAVFPKAYQEEAARRSIDEGADVVIGHHPHVPQGIEHYRGGIIFYSLGNFAFGSMSPHTDVGIMARITLSGGVTEAEVIPLDVKNSRVRYQPQILKGARARAVVSGLNRLSRRWNTEIRPEGERYLVRVNPSAPGLAVR